VLRNVVTILGTERKASPLLAEFTCKIALCLWLICTCLAIIGCAYAVLAAALLGQFWGKIRRAATATPAVTMLKPLCGAEPDLEANLASFCTQDYQGPVQIVLGVQDADDPAAAVVERLVAKLGADTVFVTDQHRHGANRKISNIINMMEYAKHDVIVLSDSDMRVGPTYLQQVVGALEAPGVGLVTCLYRGLPAAASGHASRPRQSIFISCPASWWD
jgi:ceramide glucosyltransferase